MAATRRLAVIALRPLPPNGSIRTMTPATRMVHRVITSRRSAVGPGMTSSSGKARNTRWCIQLIGAIRAEAHPITVTAVITAPSHSAGRKPRTASAVTAATSTIQITGVAGSGAPRWWSTALSELFCGSPTEPIRSVRNSSSVQ
jgi:hypothetical protein